MKIIALEGIDASGKETQTKMLVDALTVKGYKVATESFPRYATPAGALIRSTLKGEIGLSPEALHILYEVDRQDYQKTIALLENSKFDYLVLDRYTLSNLAFCMAKGISVDWIIQIQSNLRKADMTLVMDISAETSMKRKAVREDLHELDTDLLNRARSAYNFLADKFSNVEGNDELIYVVDANREPADIHDEVMSLVTLNFEGTLNN